MKVTMGEVAKKAGVSKTTVSRIINGNYNYVTEGTKQKVLRIIEDLDYRPNALAKGLKQMKTNVLGIVFSNLQNPFWSSVLNGVEDRCHELNYNLMICNSNENAQLEAEHIKELNVRQVDGIIINPTVRNQSLYEELIKEKKPLVFINRKIEGLNVNSVVMDNVKGASLGVNHLIDLNKKKIALVVYPSEGISPRLDRIEGYKQAMKKAFNETNIQIYEVNEINGEAKEKVKEVLTSSNKPEAIFSTNNMMTLEILEGIKELNMRVPEEVAVVGYDETVWSKHLNPPLTTVKQPAYEMGKLAAEQLIKSIEAEGETEKVRITLKPELIKRLSSGYKKEDLN